jgi:Flp pilus assembly protein TadG
MAAPLTQSRKSFSSDEQGSVLIIFAFCLFGLIMFLAMAIDYGRAVHANFRLGQAIDGAAIAAARAMKDGKHTEAEAKAIARKYFDENMPRSAGAYTIVSGWDPNINAADGTVTISAVGQVATLFASVAGIKTMNFPKTATAAYSSLDIEVSMQLDMTGSMDDSDARGRQKMAGLKDATNDLIDVLITGAAGTNKVRIGMAPFSSGVNAGVYANAVSSNRAANGCVFERRTAADDASDIAPIGLDDLKAQSDIAKGAQDCPKNNIVVPLTDNKATLKSAVTAFDLAFDRKRSTAGHLGTAWAWYLISPNWSSIWPGTAKPVAYSDKKTLKAMVLMTDGIYNTVGGVNGGDTSATAAQSQSKARALCDAAKAKNITIYSVGFIVPGDPPAAADTLKYCASAPGYFYKAEDSAGLKSAFKAIATDISKLRLSK